MFEVLVAASLVAAAFAIAGRGRRASTTIPLDDAETDLPCPWCLGPTAESDIACFTCGQTFG